MFISMPTTNSVLSSNVVDTLIRHWNLSPVKENHRMFARCERIGETLVHIHLFNCTMNKVKGAFGINPYTPSFTVYVHCNKWKEGKRERTSFNIFEYEDIKRVYNEVDSFIVSHTC